MKLALALGCFLLVLAGLFDLEPYRSRRLGRIQAIRRPPSSRKKRLSRG